MRKLLKSRKALSPVVAAIILIAVTVAVSIAVAAWMGALTIGFIGGAEQLNLGTPHTWVLGNSSYGAGHVMINVTNSGESTVILSSAFVGGDPATIAVTWSSGTADTTLDSGERAAVKVTYTGKYFTAGVPYSIKLVTQNNKEFSTTGTPPQ